jgi:hypothetical protein
MIILMNLRRILVTIDVYIEIVRIILSLRKTHIVQADHFIFLWILGLTVNIMSLDGTTHCLLYGKRTKKLLILSTVMRTVNELMETFTANVISCTMFLEGLMLHFSEFFLCILQTSLPHALIFNELSSEPGSTVPVLTNTWT